MSAGWAFTFPHCCPMSPHHRLCRVHRYREGVERARPKSPGETAIEAVRQAREQMQAMLAKVDARRSGAGHSASTGQPRLAQRGYGMPSSQR